MANYFAMACYGKKPAIFANFQFLIARASKIIDNCLKIDAPLESGNIVVSNGVSIFKKALMTIMVEFMENATIQFF